MEYLQDPLSPAQTANHVGISHEITFPYVYADKVAAGSSLYKELCCQKQRKSGCALIIKVSNQISESVSGAIFNKIKGMFQVVKTLTFDNCKEFAEHARKDEVLSSATCFANVFCSWQRGSNKNFNDLLSQYMPKKNPLSTLIVKEFKMIELKLNHQPLKRMGLKTSNGIFTQSLSRVAVYV